VAAISIFVGRSWDYVNDPLLGHLSDRTRSRWGRRRPFLLFGALPFAVCFCLLWWKPPISSSLGLAVYYALAYLLFDTAATFAYMPYYALTPELTPDYDERTALTSYRMFFSIFASLLAFTLPLLIIGDFNPASTGRVLLMGVIFAVASMIPLLITFAGTREREVFMQMERPGFFESLRSAFKNRPFVFSAGLFLLTWVTVGILQTTLLFFLKYVVQRESQSELIMATIFITAIFSLPLWEWVSRRWGKRRAYVAGVAFWAIVQMTLITLSPASPLPLLLGLCVMAGIGVGAAHVLPWSIIPDAIEWDEWKTGQRHEGMFYSLITLMQKVASSLAIPGILLLLELTGYLPNAPQQPASALWGIRIVIGPIPALLLAGGIALALLYPLSRQRHAEIRQQLAERRSG
jgi:GPH family glycoside/pentoside/hexuronide:cation symporter